MKTVIGENAPASKLPKAGWQLRSDDVVNMLCLGGETTTTNQASVLTPSDQWNIDSKLDDGLPNSGRILGYNISCATATDASAPYNLTYTDIACRLNAFLF